MIDFIFLGSKITAGSDCIHIIKKQHTKKQRHHFANKGSSHQSYGFSSSHVWLWELKYKEGWAPTNWCFWTVLLEETVESPLDSKEIQPLHPKGNQSWIFTERTDAEAETPILWPPDEKNRLIWKDPDSGKDWRWEEKGMIEDENVAWHHWLDGHVCSSSLNWRWIGKPCVLQSRGSQRVGHNGATELMCSTLQNVLFSLKKKVYSVAFRWSLR